MHKLKWDDPEDRTYETGLDKGVLYLPDGSAVAWNGLTSIIENFDRETSPVYYDGMKISELTALGSFSASMKAVTYPDEFIELEGLSATRTGLFYADQQPQFFGLCYRTRFGNPVVGDTDGYKIHILYNVTAIPKDKTYATLTNQPSLVEFEWDITAVPEEIPGFRPTAHIIINSKDIDPELLEMLEEILYGGPYVEASLIPMAELVQRINDFFRFELTDNGDGTWTGRTDLDGLIVLGADGYFEVENINAWYLDDVTYVAKSTKGVDETPQIKIHDVGDGTWTAHTQYTAIIEEISPGVFDIANATVNTIDANTYEISDTPEV